MYIRIQNSQIRFRVSQEEASALTEGEILLDAIALSDVVKLTYSVESTAQISKFEYSEIDNSLCLKINEVDLNNELSGRPTKEGIRLEHTHSSSRKIQVSLEIDLKRKK